MFLDNTAQFLAHLIVQLKLEALFQFLSVVVGDVERDAFGTGHVVPFLEPVSALVELRVQFLVDWVGDAGYFAREVF